MTHSVPPSRAGTPLLGRTSFAACLGIYLACGGASCIKPEPNTADPSTVATPSVSAQGADSSTNNEECRDWSTLDVASLPPLPKSPYAQTFDTAWRTVLTKHYDPTLGCLDWPALRIQYAQKLAGAKDQTEAYAVMNALLSELGQSHLMIVPPSAKTGGEVRGGVQQGRAVIPVELRYLDGEVVVTKNERFGLKSKLPAGATLLAVDDKPLAPMVAQMKSTWTEELAAAFHIARTASSWLSCPAGAKKKVRFHPQGAKAPRTKTVTCREPDVERLTMGNIRDFPTTFESRMLPGKVGYVAFNIWLLPLAPRIQSAVHDLADKKMKGLIIDLRGNPGGVGMMVVPLARVLLEGPASLGAIRMREMTQDFKVLDVDDPFAGPTVVLIDERTASTSEIFALAMRELHRVRVYGGSASQGAALPSLIEELPGGARLQYVIADYQSPSGNAVEGHGVQPDVVVPESAADFAAGRDPVLEAAVQSIVNPTDDNQ